MLYIAFFLATIVDIYIYQKMILQLIEIKQQKKLLIYAITANVIKTLLAPFSVFIDYLFLYVFLRYNEGIAKYQARYYSSYIVFVIRGFDIISGITSKTIIRTFNIDYASSLMTLTSAINLFIPFIHRRLYAKSHMKKVKFNSFPNFVIDKILKPSTKILWLGILIIWIGLTLDTFFAIHLTDFSFKISYISSLVTMFFIIFILFYVDSRARRYSEKVNNARSNQQIEDMNTYIKTIEKTNEETRSYRHDMNNIFLTLETAVENEDIESIKNIYAKVITKASTDLKETNESIRNASYIKNDALKSVIVNKIISAQNANIDIIVSLIEPITDIFINDIDYIRIVSILLDNAIEAAQLTNKPYLSFTFIYKGNNELVFVVENNFSTDYIASTSPEKLFELGVTSNKDGRGIGLHNVKAIQKKYPKDKLTIKTEIQDNIFRQTVITKK